MPALCRDCFQTGSALEAPCGFCGSTRVFAHPELDALTIAHVDCDAFYASVEKRDDPSLTDKPLLIGHDGGRGVVTTACYIARKYGCRSAMPMFKALQLCPSAAVKRPDMAKYKAASTEIRKLFREITRLIEPVSIDEAFLDLSEANRSHGVSPPVLLAQLSREVESRVGVTISTGLSSNKFLAKLASDLDKPRGFSVIGPLEARAFLAPLPVTKIHGVGKATARKMEEMGWTIVGDLQQVSERELVARFGRFGHRLAEYVLGEDSRAVKPSRAAKSISAETTFHRNLRSFVDLRAELEPLCRRVAVSLAAKGLSGRTVTLKLKTSDFQILTRRATLQMPTQRTEAIFKAAERLLRENTNGDEYRLIGAGVSDLRPEAEGDAPSLFDLMATDN